MERKLTAILCADVHGYSRLMGEDEEATLRTLAAYRKIIDSLIESHRGRFVNSAGDSILAEFTSVVEAVTCAVEIQTALKAENQDLPLARRMDFRIGVNLGDVMVEGEQIYGDGVNVAARLESGAEPGGICISHTVHDQIKNKLSLHYQDLGPQKVKNIAEPVRVFRVLLHPGPLPSTPRPAGKLLRRGLLCLAGVAMIIGAIVLVQHLSLKPAPSNASIQPSQSPLLKVPQEPSIAVLPFINLSGDPKQEYFSDGLTDYLINDLSRLPGVFVIARNSTFVYKGKAVGVQHVGRELGVRLVLEGSVLKAGNQVRISAELADAVSGSNMWAVRLDRPLQDIFAMQDEVVSKIVTTLNLMLQLGRHGVPVSNASKAYTPASLDAFDCFLHGIEYTFKLTKDDNERAEQMFEEAIKLDPNYVDAYVNLGFVYWLRWGWGWSQDSRLMDRVSELAQRAIALDDVNPGAHLLVGVADLFKNQDFSQAIAEAKHAVDLDPNFLMGYFQLAESYNHAGRGAQAVAWAEKAIRLDPLNRSWYLVQTGTGYTITGQYTEAVSALTEHLAHYPNSLGAHAMLAVAYSELGQEQQARAEVAEVRRISPQFSLEYAKQRATLWDQAFADRFYRDLSKAGLK